MSEKAEHLAKLQNRPRRLGRQVKLQKPSPKVVDDVTRDFVAGLSYSQIASKHGLASRNAVAGLIYRARAREAAA